MDIKDAEIVINILLDADGECMYCAGNLVESFIKEYPMFSGLGRRFLGKDLSVPLVKEVKNEPDNDSKE